MVEGNATLKETLAETLAETSEPAKTTEEQTPEGAEKTTPEETKAGETSEKEYVSGIDISDIPVEDRPRIKEKLEAKAKLLEDGYQVKFQEVSKFKKAQDDLVNMGLSVEEAQGVLVKHIEQKQNPTQTTQKKEEAVRTLDKLVQDAPYEQKQSLEQLRQIILEETDVTALKKEMANLKQYVGYLRGRDIETGLSKVTQDLKSLETKFGTDLVSKYKDSIIGEWRKNPQVKAKDILKYVIPDEEYEQAIIASANKGKKPLTIEKKNATQSSQSSVTSKETLDTSGNWKDTIKGLIGKK